MGDFDFQHSILIGFISKKLHFFIKDAVFIGNFQIIQVLKSIFIKIGQNFVRSPSFHYKQERM